MSRCPEFIDHAGLMPLIQPFKSYLIKGLKEVRKSNDPIKVTALELYASNIFERVGELDISIKSLRLALFFIMDLRNVKEDILETFRYHFENFLLRLSGIEDRCHLLVGVSVLVDESKLKGVGSNEKVRKAIKTDYPALISCLDKVRDTSTSYKQLRNEIAHSTAFSSRELNLFSAAKTLDLQHDETLEIKALTGDYLAGEITKLVPIIAEVITNIGELLDTLAPIYLHIASENN